MIQTLHNPYRKCRIISWVCILGTPWPVRRVSGRLFLNGLEVPILLDVEREQILASTHHGRNILNRALFSLDLYWAANKLREALGVHRG